MLNFKRLYLIEVQSQSAINNAEDSVDNHTMMNKRRGYDIATLIGTNLDKQATQGKRQKCLSLDTRSYRYPILNYIVKQRTDLGME